MQFVSGYKLHAKMLMRVYSSYFRCGVFSGVLQPYNLTYPGNKTTTHDIIQ